MANFVCFLAARRARAPWDVRGGGTGAPAALRVYASAETHTWIQKAADLFGLGTDAIRWIPMDDEQRMDVDALEARSTPTARPATCPCCRRHRRLGQHGRGRSAARAASHLPTSTLWFHVDGAYGAFAALAARRARI